MATSRRTPRSGPDLSGASGTAKAGAAGQAGSAASAGSAAPAGAGAADGRRPAAPHGPGGDERGREAPRLPPVRLAPREELAGSARVAPLLRAAREVARWLGPGGWALAENGRLPPAEAAAAMAELELAPGELDAAWRVSARTGMLEVAGGRAGAGSGMDVLVSGDAEEVLAVWDDALTLMLAAEDLDGMATALYTVGGPVKMDALFEAYVAAAGSGTHHPGPAYAGGDPEHDQAAGLSSALEALADLGVVELGTDEAAGGLTVTLSRLGVWGVHRRLRAQGWHVPVLGGGARGDAAALLATLASCDVEDGEAEIAAWLAVRTHEEAARELIDAAGRGSPGLRGAGFAVLDRIGAEAVPAARAALDDPVLHAHAAVWLHEHGEEADLGPGDRAWLLVDLGAGLLEEADPRDVVAELLPDVTPAAQAELVAGLWEVSHPGVTDLLTALSDHHPDPAVARAARKAAFKARSPAAGRALGSRQAGKSTQTS
ncbi:MAG: hypothetical protein ACHQCE_03185 [Streptosporangiales bacterium]